MEWKIDRATRSGVASSAFDVARKAARSRARPLPLAALEEPELLGEGVGVEGGLDLEDLARPLRR